MAEVARIRFTPKQKAEIGKIGVARSIGRVHARDHGAPASPSYFSAELIVLALELSMEAFSGFGINI